MATLTNEIKTGYAAQTRIWHWVIIVFIAIVCIIWLIPLMIIISASFTQESVLSQSGYRLIPPVFSTEAYLWLFRDPTSLLQAYGVTIFVTFVGTSIGVLIMSMLAFVLSSKQFKLRGVLSFYVFFTLLFSGGLVPYYINMTMTLHLHDSVVALILPYLVMPFYVLLLRTYFSTLPKELFDAAKIDGASDWRIFFQLVLPLSVPAILTVALFQMLQYWNDFFQALLFVESQSLRPLQYLLYNLMNQFLLSDLSFGVGAPPPALSVRMAMAVVALGPVIIAFLFVQRYFVRGITLGGIKGD